MLFFGDENGMLYGIDSRDQTVLPSWPQPGLNLADPSVNGLPPALQAMRIMWAPAYDDGLLYTPTHRGLFVIDVATSEIAWKVRGQG